MLHVMLVGEERHEVEGEGLRSEEFEFLRGKMDFFQLLVYRQVNELG